MRLRTRFSLRILAWILFLVGGPLLLAYARGYRLPWEVVRIGQIPTGPTVGALVVRSIPKGSTVRVNGEVVDSGTPTDVGSLRAGTHIIRVEKTGYRHYEVRLDVAPGRVTDLLHVLLLPEQPDITLRPGVRDVWVSPDERWVLLRTESHFRVAPLDSLLLNGELSPENLGGIEITLGIAPSLPVEPHWSNRYIALSKGQPGGVVIINPRTGRTFTLPTGQSFVAWDEDDAASLILRSADGTLTAYDVPARTERVLATGVLAAAPHPRGLLIQPQKSGAPRASPGSPTDTDFLRKSVGLGSPTNRFAIRRGAPGVPRPWHPNDRRHPTSPHGGYVGQARRSTRILLHPRVNPWPSAKAGEEVTPPLVVLERSGNARPVAQALTSPAVSLAVSGNGSIAAVTAEGTLLVRRPEDPSWTELATGVRSERWSPDGNKLIFQRTEFDLFAVNVSEERSVLPPLVPELLARLSTPLRSVSWYPDSQRVTLFEQDTLTLVSLDPRDGHRREGLVSVNRGDATYRVLHGGKDLLVAARREVLEPSGRPSRTADVLLSVALKTTDDR